MSLLDKVKQQAEQAAAKAREGIEDVQVKRELGQVYDELGRKTFDLVEAHTIDHAELLPIVERIRELKAKLEEEEGATAATPAEPADTAPPAMPV